MPDVIRTAKYVKSDHKKNNNKGWYITEYDDATTKVEYGRIGATFATQMKDHGNQSAAAKFFDKKCKEKERSRNGEIPYRKLDTLDSTESVAVDSLNEVAKRDIETGGCTETAKLIEHFTRVNIHQITSSTTMTFNSASGLFETPCGPITMSGISQARVLLGELSVHIENDTLASDEYGSLLNDYLMLIPQKVGRKLDPLTLFASDDMPKQNDILDSLEATYQTITTPKVDDGDEDEVEAEKVFSVKLIPVDDKSVIKRITDKYQSGLKRQHQCSHLKVSRVFAVDIATMSDKFEKVGKAIGNIKELWHGTRASNILSILKGGLVVPPSTAGHVCGRMWSDGVYFASSSTKSLNYSHGYWDSKGTDNVCYMFLADVALGTYDVPRSGSSRGYKLPKGCDSTWAQSDVSGVQNDEFIVPQTGQCNLTYLIEFK